MPNRFIFVAAVSTRIAVARRAPSELEALAFNAATEPGESYYT